MALVLIIFGISTLFWAVVGIGRYVSERVANPSGAHPDARLSPTDVAIVIAAHNEAAVIDDAIDSAAMLVPRSNIFVISDASTDETVRICRDAGVNVLDLTVNRGKAGAIVAGIRHFDIARNFEVVMLMDADTRPRPDYLRTGLPEFNDPEVVAVAGYAMSSELPLPPTRMGVFLVRYRQRFYAVLQVLFKYGQASKRLNVLTIVPGFASMYRTWAIEQIEIDAPGLIIEDFNMTFEVHARKLGRIAFRPSAAGAYTQDPDNLRDYLRQVRRWTLGFWQTVRRHGIHAGMFWYALAAYIAELLLSSLVLIVAIPLLAVSIAGSTFMAAADGVLGIPYEIALALPPHIIALGLFLPDLMLTLIAVVALKRPVLLCYAPFFLFMRIVDSAVCLRTLPKAWRESAGVWTSPARRGMKVIAVEPVI